MSSHSAIPTPAPHDCTQDRRIGVLETRVDSHDLRLSAGDVGFAEVRKDLHSLAEKVGALTNAAYWLIGVVIFGVLSTAGGVLIWALGQMGKP